MCCNDTKKETFSDYKFKIARKMLNTLSKFHSNNNQVGFDNYYGFIMGLLWVLIIIIIIIFAF